MLPKQYRLLLRRYQDFFSLAQRIHTPHFVVYSLPDEVVLQKTPQVAVIVPKKKAVSAVAKNQAKRVIRSAVQALLPELQPKLLVVYLKKKWANTTSFAQIQAELQQGFRKIKG